MVSKPSKKHLPWKKLLGLLIIPCFIPQALYLIYNITWLLLLFLVLFLLFEVGILFIIKTIYPDKVNISQIVEWTLTVLVETGVGLAYTFGNLFFSFLGLVFGQVFHFWNFGNPKDRNNAKPISKGSRVRNPPTVTIRYNDKQMGQQTLNTSNQSIDQAGEDEGAEVVTTFNGQPKTLRRPPIRFSI